MSDPSTATAPPPVESAARAARPAAAPARGGRAAVLGVGMALLLLVLVVVHLTQGTSTIGASDLLRLLLGQGDQGTLDVLVASRLPRLLAAVTVGAALGVSGALLQSVARNPLASPDTLAVNAGAHLAVVAAAAFGFSLPVLSAGGLAFLGGLAATGLVLVLAAGGSTGPARLILAGSAVALALSALTMLLLLLYEQNTVGLFAWGNGSLVQSDLTAVSQLAPVVVVAVAGGLLLSRRMDALSLGDDPAAVLGVKVRQTRLAAVGLAVVLAAAAVTLAGPLGFVGLCAPAIVRLLAPMVPGLHRHRVLLPATAVAGMLVVVGADVGLRALFGGQAGVEVPTGAVTTVLGATVLVLIARRMRGSGPGQPAQSARLGAVPSRRTVTMVITLGGLVLVGATVLAMLAGDTWLLTGDVVNWLRGQTGPYLTSVLDQRFPRVAAALLAGAALAVAGTVVQAVCRNPLAEPGIIGITGGAGVAAVGLLTLMPLAGTLTMSAAAGVGALAAFALVYGLSWRGGLHSDRLVLIGVGVWIGGQALTTIIIIGSDPWNTSKALTWLSGSTYGRGLDQVAPVAIMLLLMLPLLIRLRRELDVLALDDDTPRVLGIRLEGTRLVALTGAAVLTATAVSAVGVVGFVGLVAPHAARALVGGRHTRVLPVAMLLGAILVSLADTIGRSVIAPAQIPAGLMTAMLGTPYFVWLLWRSRPRVAGAGEERAA
jgi:ABC-type Fe3+-siderophore transport system permease subunit